MNDRPAHDWSLQLFHHDELLIETWNDGLGSISTEIAVSKRRIDDPADAATHMSVQGQPLPPQPWADLTGYTTPREGKPSPRSAFPRRVRATSAAPAR